MRKIDFCIVGLKSKAQLMIWAQKNENYTNLGAVHMSQASPANRADLSHENLYFSTT